MDVETFHHYMRVGATVGLISVDLISSVVNPGPLDAIHAIVAAFAVFSIWFTRERKPNS